MIGLQITLVAGESANQQTVFQFEASNDNIVVGCDAERCDVVLSSVHLKHGVGHEHLAFKRSLGAYELDLNTRHFVSVDGVTAFEGQEIQGITTIKLGDGVTLEVEVLDCREAAGVKQQAMHQVGSDVAKQRQWMTVMGVVLFSLLALGLFLNRDVGDIQDEIADKTKSVTNALVNVNNKVDKVKRQRSVLDPEVIEELGHSVYLVIKKGVNGSESAVGTAWSVDSNHLATNAHVAENFNKLSAGESLYVRSSFSPYQSFKVIEFANHPGYELYETLWKEYKPVRWLANKQLAYMQTAHPADVALIAVESGLPSKGLTLASDEEITNLKAGQEVAFIGFPSERLLPNTISAPSPVMQADEIVRVSDFFMVEQGDGSNRLIQHGLPITGGASGSPIFNENGHVIGLISSGNVVNTLLGRLVNPADINFGQRVDFLRDLIDGTAKTQVANYQQHWQKSLMGFDTEQGANKKAILDHIKSVYGLGLAEDEAQFEYSLPKAKQSKYEKDVVLHFDKPGLYLVSMSSEGRSEKLKIKFGSTLGLDQLNEQIPYANLMKYQMIIVDKPTYVKAFVSFKAKRGSDFNPEFKLTQFYWPVGYDQFHEKYAHQWLKKQTNDQQLIEVSHLASQIANLESISYENSLGEYEAVVRQKGIYYITVTPLGDNAIKVKLRLGEDQKLIKPKHEQGSSILVVDKTNDLPQKLKLLIEGKGEDSSVKVNLYLGKTAG